MEIEFYSEINPNHDISMGVDDFDSRYEKTGILEACWLVLGTQSGVLEASWALLEASWAVLEASWGVLKGI